MRDVVKYGIVLLIGLFIGWLIWASPVSATTQKKAYCHKNSGQKTWTYHFNKAWVQHFRNNGSPRAGHEGDFLTWKGNRECIKGDKPTPTPTPTPKPPRCYWSEWSECSAECGGGVQTREWIGDKRCEDKVQKRRCNTQACGTIRWCFPCQLEDVKTDDNGHKYCARAIPKDEKPEVGFPWEEGMDKWCEKPPEPTPTPTPSPEPTPQPKSDPSPAGAPQCTDTAPVHAPANPLVWRKGGTAIVQWQPTGGDKAHIYYYQNQEPSNAHAVRDTENDGYVEIGELGGLDWTFGIQQANGCAGGETVWVVDGGTNGWMLFRP